MVVAVAVLAGCGGSSTGSEDASPTAAPTLSSTASSTVTTSTTTTTSPNSGTADLLDLNAVRSALPSGVACEEPAPYVAAEDEIDIGESPVEKMECTVDGRPMEFAAWATANDRGVSYAAGLDLACSFGVVSVSYIADGVWVAAPDESADADNAALGKVAEALGLEVETKIC